MGMTIEITPKGDTVGELLSAILTEYINASNYNGLKVHKIVVNDCLVYWDNEKVLKEWENGNDG